MENISTYFKLEKSQSQLDFIDIKLDDDNLLFIDPRLIEIGSSKLNRVMAGKLYEFFGHLVLYVSTGKNKETYDLLSGLKEPKETRLGFGFQNIHGKGSGSKTINDLVNALINNPVIKEKKINSLSDLSFFLPNFRSDRISDFTTKIIKGNLIDYTQNQCKKLGIPMERVFQMDIFNAKTLQWESKYVELPVYTKLGVKEAIIFVPKDIVSRQSEFNSNLNCFFRYARNFIIKVSDSKFTKGIKREGKNNTIRVKDFDSSISDIKAALSQWVIEHPIILNNYWKHSLKQERIRHLTDREIEEIVYDDKFNRGVA